jgi:hypothetical protein
MGTILNIKNANFSQNRIDTSTYVRNYLPKFAKATKYYKEGSWINYEASNIVISDNNIITFNLHPVTYTLNLYIDEIECFLSPGTYYIHWRNIGTELLSNIQYHIGIAGKNTNNEYISLLQNGFTPSMGQTQDVITQFTLNDSIVSVRLGINVSKVSESYTFDDASFQMQLSIENTGGSTNYQVPEPLVQVSNL